ncbi:MAG: class I SAM-dependent methyltransferase [Candidatus Limnocylindrales bacterium]
MADDRARPSARYFQGDRRDLMSWLDGQWGRVLEIGCGEGGNALWLRAHGASRIVGIELDPASATRARDQFDEIVAEPVESGLGRLDEEFDLIICADVLEHLVDPWATVAALAQKAAPGATLVVSIPNIRFARTLWQIAFGEGFSYTTEGIFDRTHLRFFTRRNVAAMLRDGGWRPVRWGYSPSQRLARLRAGLWALTGGRSGEFLAYQWYVAATLAGIDRSQKRAPSVAQDG